MAQHDYVIANGTGAAVRSDLNNALAAIVSQNSGATAPSTTYAYQWWADTATGLLKLRNAANNGWITLFQLDGEWSTIALENGSAAAPSIYFKDSGTDTGIYSPGTDQVAISTGGTVRFTTSTTAFTGTLPWQGQNGTAAAPAISFSGDSNTGIYNAGADQLGIATNGTNRATISTTAFASTLPMSLPLGAVGTPSVTFTGDLNTGIYSPGADTLAFVEGGAEAMRIDSSGRVGIGTTTASTLLHLASSDPVIRLQDTDTNAYGQIAVDNSGNVTIQADESNAQASSSIRFNVDGSERVRLDSSGRFLVGTSSWSVGATAAFVGNSSSSTGNADVHFSRGLAATGLSSGQDISVISFSDNAGGKFAQIGAQVDGTPGSSDYPGRLVFSTTADGASSPTERMRIDNAGTVTINTTGAKLRMLSGAGTSSWGQGIRIGHDDTYYAGIFCNGDSNFDRQYLDFWTSRATSAGLIARLTDRFYCNVTTITAFSSERRYKQNIDLEPLAADKCWEVARDLPVRTYEYKDNPGNMVYGPIVDEIEPIDPSLILDTGRTDDEGPVRTYDNGRLQAMYHVALQTALKRIETLEAEVAALKAS